MQDPQQSSQGKDVELIGSFIDYLSAHFPEKDAQHTELGDKDSDEDNEYVKKRELSLQLCRTFAGSKTESNFPQGLKFLRLSKYVIAQPERKQGSVQVGFFANLKFDEKDSVMSISSPTTKFDFLEQDLFLVYGNESDATKAVAALNQKLQQYARKTTHEKVSDNAVAESKSEATNFVGSKNVPILTFEKPYNGEYVITVLNQDIYHLFCAIVYKTCPPTLQNNEFFRKIYGLPMTLAIELENKVSRIKINAYLQMKLNEFLSPISERLAKEQHVDSTAAIFMSSKESGNNQSASKAKYLPEWHKNFRMESFRIKWFKNDVSDGRLLENCSIRISNYVNDAFNKIDERVTNQDLFFRFPLTKDGYFQYLLLATFLCKTLEITIDVFYPKKMPEFEKSRGDAHLVRSIEQGAFIVGIRNKDIGTFCKAFGIRYQSYLALLTSVARANKIPLQALQANSKQSAAHGLLANPNPSASLNQNSGLEADKQEQPSTGFQPSK